MTPQQNHLVEMKMALLANKGVALIIEGNVLNKLFYKVFCEEINTATLTDGLTVIINDERIATN